MIFLFATVFLAYPVTSYHVFGPSFFANVADEAKSEYYALLNNDTISRGDQKKALISWAEENDVENEVHEFMDKQWKQLMENRKNITIFLKSLIEKEEELSKTILDDSLSSQEREEAIQKFDVPPQVRRIMGYISGYVRRHGPELSKPMAISTTPAPSTRKVEVSTFYGIL